jgi:glucosamine-6-phosphate deaminase
MRNIHVASSAAALGAAAAEHAAQVIEACIKHQGYARIILATGVSQFEFLKEFCSKDLDWSRVEMFHLDEYLGLPESHRASFRKYLRERILVKVPVTKYHLVNGEGDVDSHLEELTSQLREAPIDLAMIGIGENGHIAFNDPPADFDSTEAYKVVTLNESCKTQQVREG